MITLAARLALVGFGVASLAALVGCQKGPSAAELRGAEYTVRRVYFEGVTRFDDDEIHEYLELRPTDWLPLPKRHWYYEGLLPVDAERIIELYHAHGYYEVRVVDVRVEHIDRAIRNKVDITYVIDEGPVTAVEGLVVRWPEGPPPGPPEAAREGVFIDVPSIDPEDVSQKVELERGEAFEIPRMRASSAAMRETLREAGHPFAAVDERARVDKLERRAEVEFTVRPGPFLRIGEIRFVGLETVPRSALEVEVEDFIGRPYSPARIEVIEQRIYGVGMFATVSVELEDGDEDGDGAVDLLVRVREKDPQRVRLGVAFGIEPNRWEQRFAARYQHENLFRDLYELSLTGRLGYAELPSLVRPIAHGPVFEIDVHGEKKGLLEDHLVWTVDPNFEVGVEQGYQYWAIGHRFGVSRFFTRWVQLELSHSLRHVDFFNVSPQLLGEDTLLGLDFRDPYLISHVDIGAMIWAVDAIASPSDGAVIGVDYRVAGGPFGGQYDYQEVSPYIRGYWRPIERLQLATRARVGMIFPYGDQPGAPIDMRRYLGGTTSVRGWGLRRLAPRIDDCEPGESARDGECESIPVGGNSSVLASVELRVRTWKKLWAAVFVDMGDVQPGVSEFRPRQWNYSTGAGLRLETPVGKFRLDVGFRLNETEISRNEPIWAVHFGLGESF